MGTNLKPMDQKAIVRTVKLALLGAAFASLCLLFLGMFTWFEPDQISLSDRYFPSATTTWTKTPTPTRTLTFTPTMTLTLTPSPIPTNTPTPTLTSPPHVLLPPPEGVKVWEQTFDSTVSDWEPYYADNTVRVEDGKLFVKSEKRWGSGMALCVDCIGSKQTFYFQAELLLEKEAQITHGLSFCVTPDDDKYYSFLIDQTYSLFRLQKDPAHSLYDITAMHTKSINKYPQTNILAVYFEEGKMDLYINNVPVHSYIDPDPLDCRSAGVMLSKGYVGLLADNIFIYTKK